MKTKTELNREKILEALSKTENGLSVKDLAAETGLTNTTINYRMMDLRKEGRVTNSNGVYRLSNGEIYEEKAVMAESKKINEEQASAFAEGVRSYVSAFQINEAKSRPIKSKHWVVISDLHVPFHDIYKLNKVISENFGSNLIIAGDFFDGYELSRYEKDMKQPFEEEIKQARAFLEVCSAHFNNIYLLGGNHDQLRWKKFLLAKVPDEVKFLVKDPYDELIKGLQNVHIVGFREAPKNHQVRSVRDWLIEVGNGVWISHGQFSASGGKGAAEQAAEYIKTHLGVIPKLVIQGHTHKLNHNCFPHTQTIENGCLVEIEGPGLEYNRNFRNRPHVPVNGHSGFYLDDNGEFIKAYIRKL